jgi:hypothetical protein
LTITVTALAGSIVDVVFYVVLQGLDMFFIFLFAVEVDVFFCINSASPMISSGLQSLTAHCKWWLEN